MLVALSVAAALALGQVVVPSAPPLFIPPADAPVVEDPGRAARLTDLRWQLVLLERRTPRVFDGPAMVFGGLASAAGMSAVGFGSLALGVEVFAIVGPWVLTPIPFAILTSLIGAVVWIIEAVRVSEHALAMERLKAEVKSLEGA
jgi:hypothetical protein